MFGFLLRTAGSIFSSQIRERALCFAASEVFARLPVPVATETFHSLLLTAGWLYFDHRKIKNCPAQWWVIVLVSHERKANPQFVVIPPTELLSRLVQIHGISKRYQFYLGSRKPTFAWKAGGFTRKNGRGWQKERLISAREILASQHLNKWPCLDELKK